MRGDVRAPAHAGSFYPASPEALRRLVDAQLAEAAAHTAAIRPAVQRPVGLVVPHAGLVYSGRVAASAWGLLREEPPEAIVIAGTNHYWPGLEGVAVWPSGAWKTPLGDVPVAALLAAEVLALGDPFEAQPAAHRREHSIEVQLPFIARACPGVPIVPLLVSFASPDAALSAGAALGRLLAELGSAGLDVVLAASSDFAHYPPAAEAEAVTRSLVPPLLVMDGRELARREEAIRRSGRAGLVCGMCGIEPVLFAVGAFGAMGLAAGRLLAAGTSADVPGADPDRTVGYAAIGFDTASS
jgi:AmmeMemoRadiSam system protein B